MRYTTQHKLAHQLLVKLDGVEQKYAIVADTDEGFIECIKMQDNGRVACTEWKLKNPDNPAEGYQREIVKEIKHGHVEVTLKDGSPVPEE